MIILNSRFKLTSGLKLLAIISFATTPVFAQQPLLTPIAQTGDKQTQLEARIQRLEQVFENQILREMIQNMEQLQVEMRDLRGELELQRYEIERMQSRQRDLYQDTDRRLREIELGGAVAGAQSSLPTSPSVTSPNRPTTAAPAAKPTAQPTSPATGSPTAEGGEKQAYQAAFELLKTSQYQQASNAFVAFIKRYPNGRYTANAQYWLGEVSFVSKAFEQALKQFRVVVDNFPSSPKVPDAQLKIGFVYYEMSKWPEAYKTLQAVVASYPNSSVARLAQQRLVRMKQEGR